MGAIQWTSQMQREGHPKAKRGMQLHYSGADPEGPELSSLAT